MKEPTILCIEDNLGNQRLMRAIFETIGGWHLMMSENAEAGVDLARKSRPDVILMDINLPGMSGCEALMVLRKDPPTSQIPILALTANRMPCLDTPGSGDRFDAVILKPFTRSELIDPIRRALSLAASEGHS